MVLMVTVYVLYRRSYEFTRHHSPLYALPIEEELKKEYHEFNTNYTINYWIDGGAKRNQILLGIPAFGKGFKLADENKNGFYSPITALSQKGPYTAKVGLLSFHEYCEVVDQYKIVRVMSVFHFRSES